MLPFLPVAARASGTFDVKLTPQPMVDNQDGLARMSIDKQFHGDLEGTSKGEMLSAGTNVKRLRRLRRNRTRLT